MSTKTLTQSFKVNADEAAVINQKVARSGLKKSEFFRKKLVHDQDIFRPVDKEFQRKLLFLMSNISNNCNQVAKRCNINKAVDRETLERLEEIVAFAKSVTKAAK